jgi:hypothetical protein
LTRTTFMAIFLMLGLAACASAQYSTVWAQPPGTPGLAPSQFSQDAAFFAECADDFRLDFDAEIVRVRWRDTTVGGDTPDAEAAGRTPAARTNWGTIRALYR